MHDCLATWLHGYTEERKHGVWCMYDVGCKADPAFLVMAIYVHGCTYAWVLAISSFSQRNPAREVGAKVPSSFRWQRIHHKSPVFCNRHCLNVCEQIRKHTRWTSVDRSTKGTLSTYKTSIHASRLQRCCRWQRITRHKTPAFFDRHCLNVCEQIRKTQAEPQWIVAYRSWSRCKGAVKLQMAKEVIINLQCFVIDIV